MKYVGTLPAVRDMARSRQFYYDVPGLNVTAGFGANVALEGGIALQTAETRKDLICTDAVTFRRNSAEICFEETDMDAFLRRLANLDIEYVHPLKEHVVVACVASAYTRRRRERSVPMFSDAQCVLSGRRGDFL